MRDHGVRAIGVVAAGMLVLALPGCSPVGPRQTVAPAGTEASTAEQRTTMALFGPIDPRGADDPQACLEYPPWVSIDRGGTLPFLLEAGWVRMPAGGVLAHLDRSADVDREETGAVAQVGVLRPSDVPGAVPLHGSAPPTPVHSYLVERLQAHGHRYDQLFVHFAGPGRYAGISVAGATAAGDVEFLMDCGARHASWLQEQGQALASPSSPAVLLEELLRHPEGEVARTVRQPERRPTRAEAWQQIPADERPLDPELTPPSVLDQLREVSVWYDLPESWQAVDAAFCPRIEQGWSACAALDSGVTAMGVHVEPGETVEWMLVDSRPRLDAPLASLATIPADRLLGGPDEPGMLPVLRASVPATSVAELVAASGEGDLLRLEWAHLDELEAELVDP